MTNYFLIPAVDLTKQLTQGCDQTRLPAVRTSLDGLQVVLSYSDTKKPDPIVAYELQKGALVFKDVKAMQIAMNDPAWAPSDKTDQSVVNPVKPIKP